MLQTHNAPYFYSCLVAFTRFQCPLISGSISMVDSLGQNSAIIMFNGRVIYCILQGNVLYVSALDPIKWHPHFVRLNGTHFIIMYDRLFVLRRV